MTSQEQLKAVATFCEWTLVDADLYSYFSASVGCVIEVDQLDMNSIHEAYTRLSPSEQIDFVKHLCSIYNEEAGVMITDYIHDPVQVTALMLDSNAKRWTDAFIRTIQKQEIK